MGWTKNLAIKTTTKKRATQLWNGLKATLDANPNMQPKEALIKYMENISAAERMFPVNPAGPSLIDVFSEYLNNEEPGRELLWHQLFALWTTRLVFNELSYDSTIGTDEDLKMVHNVVYDLLGKWTKNV
jgi:hypothetical protein